MLFAGRKEGKHLKENNLKFNIGSNKIEVVTYVRYLGVVIESNLKFNKHPDYICKRKKIGVVIILGDIVTRKTKVTLYIYDLFFILFFF